MPKPHELLEALPANTKLALDIASLGTTAGVVGVKGLAVTASGYSVQSLAL